MDEQLKQRLIGAVILVALGVIFIPAILDNSGEQGQLTVQMEIPPKPDTVLKQKLQDTQKKRLALDSIQAIDKPPSKPESADVKNSEKNTPIVEKDKTAESKQTKTVKHANKTPQAQNKKKDSGNKWVLQLGSFREEDNARKLTNLLKGKKYNAFMEKSSGLTGPVYRVRVGPVTDRKSADKLLVAIINEGYPNTIVMGYSN